MAMPFFADNVPWWWLGGICGTLLVVMLSAVMMPFMSWGDKKQGKTQAKAGAKRKPSSGNRKDDSPGKLEDEPWFPEVEFRDWQDAVLMQGCPWSFDGCDSVEDLIKCIWRNPLHTGLQQAMTALISRTKNVRVARVHYRMTDETFYSVVYTLKSGAELFGGQPLEMAVGLELDEGISEPGLRRRNVGGDDARTQDDDTLGNGLCCLAPFYRIHDGFGCLLSSKHLAVLLANPGDTIQGSCYYVYPTRHMEPVQGAEHLVKFARVDKQCAAAADIREEHPHVVFSEHTGDLTEDDEPPMDFVADTICNIAGQKVVPDGMCYHAYGGGKFGGKDF